MSLLFTPRSLSNIGLGRGEGVASQAGIGSLEEEMAVRCYHRPFWAQAARADGGTGRRHQ